MLLKCLGDVKCSGLDPLQVKKTLDAMKTNTGAKFSCEFLCTNETYVAVGLTVVCWDGTSPSETCLTPPSFAWSMDKAPCSWSFAVQFNSISSSALSYTAVFQPNLPQSLPASVAIVHSAFSQTKAKVIRHPYAHGLSVLDT
jgi:hypothetical protein